MNDKTFLAVAIKALRHYGLEHHQLTRLGGASNINFKVDIDDRSYLLRLHISASHDRNTISSELVWLDSLQRDTSLILPKPIINLNAELVTEICSDRESETLCTLMSWLEGKIPPIVDALTDKQLATVGSLMAQLHQQSQQFRLPEGFKRPIYDEAHFRKRLEVLYRTLSNTDIDKSDLNSFKSDAERIINYFAQMKRDRDNFGVIHADFHSGNYLVCDEKMHIIDFDRCGFGFYLYDLAIALMELQEQQQKVFLEGYEIIKPLPANFTDLNQMFLSLAYLDNLGFHAPNPDELGYIVGDLPLVAKAFRDAVEMVF